MIIALFATIAIVSVLIVKHLVVTRVLIGNGLFKLPASVEDGCKRVNPNSLFLIASTLWLVFGLYLYVWKTTIFLSVQAFISVFQMPESLRTMALKLTLFNWASIALGITALFLLWKFISYSRKRMLTIGSKGLAIGDSVFLWSELSDIELTVQRFGFMAEKKVHHYSWTLSDNQYKQLQVICSDGQE